MVNISARYRIVKYTLLTPCSTLTCPKLIIFYSVLNYPLLLATLTDRVELEGRGCTEVWIKAIIVQQIVKVLGVPFGNVLDCVNFGPVYFGSSKTEQISLYNESPEYMDWVAVLEDNAVGGEMVRNSGFSFWLKTSFIYAFLSLASQQSFSVVFTMLHYLLTNRLSETSVQPPDFLLQSNLEIKFFRFLCHYVTS